MRRRSRRVDEKDGSDEKGRRKAKRWKSIMWILEGVG
jgi:hypothetical protein